MMKKGMENRANAALPQRAIERADKKMRKAIMLLTTLPFHVLPNLFII